MTQIPFYSCNVAAGFPSPADDHITSYLDLNEHVIKHKSATFFFRMQGESMVGKLISPGNLLVVDRSLQPKNGDIIIAEHEGQFIARQIKSRFTLHKEYINSQKLNDYYLCSGSPNFPDIKLDENSSFKIWGVVSWVLNDLASNNVESNYMNAN